MTSTQSIGDAPANKPNQSATDDATKAQGECRHSGRVQRYLGRRPKLSIGLAAGAGFLAANAFGAGELVIAIAAGYGAYRLLHKHRSAGVEQAP